MLGKISAFTTLGAPPVDSQVELYALEEYLINTDQIIEMEDASELPTVTTIVYYKFNFQEDKIAPFYFLANETVAAITTLSDATPDSSKIALTVYDDIQTFDMIPNATTTTWNFEIEDIIWGQNSPGNRYSRIWVKTGGNKVTPYIVAQSIDDIVDLADTGTTTTTTTTTTSS